MQSSKRSQSSSRLLGSYDVRASREHYLQRASNAYSPWDLPLSNCATISKSFVIALSNACAQRVSPKHDPCCRSCLLSEHSTAYMLEHALRVARYCIVRQA